MILTMLNKQQLFADFDYHLCADEKPSLYFADVFYDERVAGAFPFKLLADLSAVLQSPQHHPEGNVWKHTLLVVDRAAERKGFSHDPRVLMWAALLHDLGKVPATRVRNGRITAYDHDKMGEKLAADFLQAFEQDQEFVQAVAKLVRWHMQFLFVVKNLPFARLEEMVREVDIHELGLLSICDRLGRGELSERQMMKEHESLAFFLKTCRSVQEENSLPS